MSLAPSLHTDLIDIGVLISHLSYRLFQLSISTLRIPKLGLINLQRLKCMHYVENQVQHYLCESTQLVVKERE